MLKKHKNSKNLGFTLIELLVVVAIIGILSGVVLVALSSAREKGKIASIKSTLKQIYNQASLNQLESSSYASSNSGYSNLDCTGPGNNLLKIAQPLIDQGVIVKCFSFDGTPYGVPYTGDVYQRFGATALIYDAGELKAWSVDENGVAKWDTQGVNSSGAFVTPDITATWANAKSYCALSGGKLPSIEQARSLYWAYYQGAGATATPFTPNGFGASNYWSSTPGPSSPATLAYYQSMTSGTLASLSQGFGLYVRCVR